MAARLKPARIEHVVDGVRLRAQLSAAYSAEGDNARGTVLRLLHGALFRGRMIAKERLESGEHGLAVARLLAAVADEVVAALFDYTTTHVFRARNPTKGERFAVMAVGGYGRGELAPSSDLDLLFLRAYKPTPFSEQVTEYMLYMLWDMGLKVGHSSRNIEECLKLAREDHTIQTALLESRRLAGDESLAEEFLTRFRKEVVDRDHAGFIAAKLRERDERHARIGASRYMVEPNLKEGKGGLRDLHTLFWLVKHCYGFGTAHAYVEAGVFSAEERNAFRRAMQFLWTVRCHLHFLTGRGEERLTFDLQPELAIRMGYGARANQSAVERFMKRYFLVAREVGALTRVLCAKLEADQAKRAPAGLQRLMPAARKRTAEIEPGFYLEAGRLNIEGPQAFSDPANLIRLFTIAAQRNLDVHPEAFGEAARRARAISPAWRKRPETRAAFLDAIALKRPPAALRLMNEAGVLGKFVPEFGRVVGQMQFNMYHHYTVDEHTLQAIDAMSEIEEGRHKNQHPLSTEIFSKIINRRALYLAMLLHDTGKGEGDQQIEGAKSARAACERLGLPPEEVELVAWLVGNHLVMSDVAQKRDIGDPRTVSQFAAVVGNVERLRLLLVLTVADIRAVGPSVWNDWKGQLLRDLYRLTEAALHGGRSDEQSVREHLAQLAREAKTELLRHVAVDDDLAGWLDALEDGYWLNHDAEALAWHAREVMAARKGRAIPHVAARIRPVQAVTEVIVYAGDRPGLFASFAAAIATCGGDIVNARVHTTKDGAAFDVFSVQTSDRQPFGADDPEALEAMITRLNRAALEDVPAPPPRPASRRSSAFAIDPWVRLDNALTPEATVVEASGRDRLGLLAGLSRVFAESKVTISSAHIETLGERAWDVFYVQEEGGGQITNPRRVSSLRAKLEGVLRAAEPAAPADPARQPLAVARASTAR
ncbi:MAG: [protein-PII] uridylyltransferase [Hyphomonadaceae bacterium]|nr:[protein-PII] uridylyltransferase [Hyphomonadaceae bacterium]MBX3510277.1 [protein-PII] uridylyltransferase [Hyphomonadaceae bacterium]